jgi:hypothetical protein
VQVRAEPISKNTIIAQNNMNHVGKAVIIVAAAKRNACIAIAECGNKLIIN